ncbi:MAG: DUF3291 domain-containing protein [Aphanothece sp. CMT-3BRIN-NPC111]|jgi:hypothetical protein|nr:DUF3291 domain-containing protein [Aphanothece sp. CMT-3BRIN-NPC111]
MVFVSATRLRIRSPLSLPAFSWSLLFTTRQTINTPGFLGGKLWSDANRAFWTLTLWEEQAAMKIYRNSGAHRAVMPRIQDWCDEASVVHWQQEDSNLPDWLEVHRRMVADGFFTKLSKPSPAHLERNISQPVSSDQGLLLRPKRKNPNQSQGTAKNN